MPRWIALAALVLPVSARAHGSHAGTTPQLHEGYAYDSCYIDLHPELTQKQFGTFTGQFGSAGAFLPMAGARALGGGHVAVGLNYQKTFLNDAEPQWNHTFTHPGDDHWLGEPGLPVIQGRVGLTRRLGVEAMITGDPSSNWGVLGTGVRAMVLEESVAMPLSLAGRLTWTHLLGAPELAHDSVAAEVLASRTFGPVTPYLGAALAGAFAREQALDVDLDPVQRWSPRLEGGVEIALGKLRITGQGTLASVPSVAVLAGGSF